MNDIHSLRDAHITLGFHRIPVVKHTSPKATIFPVFTVVGNTKRTGFMNAGIIV
jgi:hypothetical protein